MVFDIRDFGAVGDGKAVCTEAIQHAIDACSSDGGGTILVKGGEFVTGTIFLKSFVMLRVEGGASLLGSTNIDDYSPDVYKCMYRGETNKDRCLIFAEGVRGIGIEGNGVIDGRGNTDNFPSKGMQTQRPMLIRFLECSNIRVRDITLINPASWTSAWLYCSDIVVDGIRIHSRANVNGDGLDFDGCTDVRVSNSSFDTSDDSICLQTSREDRPCRDIVITNCVFCSRWAGMRIGLLSRGDFENVTVTGCVFRDIDDSGLKIQMCEGGEMKNMVFSSLLMQNVPRPVFITLSQLRACTDASEEFAPVKALRKMVFSNILVDSGMCGKDSAIVISGVPGHDVEDISFYNIRMTTGGGGTVEDAGTTDLLEFYNENLEGWWPEYHILGRPVPAYGIYARHVKGLRVMNFIADTEQEDLRPAITLHDAKECEIPG